MPYPSSRRTARRPDPSAPDRRDLYDEVTDRIIAELEAGRFPWAQPWGRVEGADAGAGVGLPRNARTGRTYSGVNILILWGAVIARGFPSQHWLTFRQAQAAGGAVIKGERGTTVVYADRFIPKAEGERAARDGDDARAVPFLKRFTVFNVAQCEGLRAGLVSEPAPLAAREIVPVAEDLIAATGADIRIGGSRAYYMPAHDFVALPPQPAFFEQINYYRTALHELTHNAATRIMPRGLWPRVVFRPLAARRFGIIRDLPRTRGAGRRVGTGLPGWAEQRRERAPSPSSACRRGCRSGWSRRSRDQARARSPLDQHRDAAGPSRCCGAAYGIAGRREFAGLEAAELAYVAAR